jgi:CelD/BcsL family acetyltransferase involved in cellulose biosynthesis
VVCVDDPEVIAYLPVWLDTLHVAHLYRVPASSPIVEAASHNDRWHVQSVFKMPYLDLSDGFDAVLASMSKNRRSDVRRCRRRLAERGDLRFVAHPNDRDVSSSLSAGLELQARGWKGEHGHAVLNNPVHERWYRSLAEVTNDVGWLRVSSLYLDDRLLSFAFGLWVDGVAYGMLNAYDESDDVRSLSPGNVLFGELFAHAADEGMNRYELGSGDDPWKFQWTRNADLAYDLLLFGAGVRGRALNMLRNRLRSHDGDSEERERELAEADNG